MLRGINTTGRKQTACKHCLLSKGNNNPEGETKSQKCKGKSRGELVHVSSQILELVYLLCTLSFCLFCTGEYTGGFSIPVLQLYVGDGGIKHVTCLIS